MRRSGPALVRETTPGKLPAFVASLLPEGWLAQALHDREALKRGRRYISNVTVVEIHDELAALPTDILTTRLNEFTEGGRFTDHHDGPTRSAIEEIFEENLARIFARADTPRLSGVQIKAPMYLTADDALLPVSDLPCTHILKPPDASKRRVRRQACGIRQRFLNQNAVTANSLHSE